MKLIKRFLELGFAGCIQAINRRFNKYLFKLYIKLNKLIPTKLIPIKSYNTKFLDEIIKSEEFLKYIPQKFTDKTWIIQQADLVASRCFNILGSGEKCFECIPWQKDFKAFEHKNVLTSHWQNQVNIFYQDINISCPQNMNLYQYNTDAKVPWELSRFQHLFILGKAYQIAKQNNDPASCKKYRYAFEYQISDWIKQNPYPYGINWVCPMDVAIRVINWIWGFYFFKDSEEIPINFKNLFLKSLHNHAKYLEWNWETSDKPNNHYISDLIGYLYLCEFFKIKKHNWCIKKILEQFFHQIQSDGTCYEGTTNYHTLDFELFLHFKLICQYNQIKLPKEFLNYFEKMSDFLKSCRPSAESLIQIGDNDSGKIVTGIEINESDNKNFVENYPKFGISIIKNSEWHISFRYPQFSKNQPTGHFHQDALSLTLNFNKIPILIDPGTYLYTANESWRNLMRSWKMHNTFNIVNLDEIKSDMFQLPLKEQSNQLRIIQSDKLVQLTAKNQKNNGSTAHRMLKFNKKTKCLRIIDWWNTKKEINTEWNLIFNPELELKKKDAFSWIILKAKIPLLEIYSSLEFTLNEGFHSKGYGFIEPCPKLTSTKLVLNEKQQIIINPLN